MPAETARLFLLEDLEQAAATGEVAGSDLEAMRATAEWIKSFIVKPNKELGRDGPVCPFVPKSLEYRTLWLAPERIADRYPQFKLRSGWPRPLKPHDRRAPHLHHATALAISADLGAAPTTRRSGHSSTRAQPANNLVCMHRR